MSESQLERLVWRCEHEQVTEEELDYHLREEARRLGDEFASREAQRLILRRWNPDLIKEFEEARSQTYKLLDRRDYREALLRLRSAAKLLATMTLLAQSHAEIELAEFDSARLFRLAQAERLRELPTISWVTQMIKLAKRFIRDKQYGQASFVARFCRRRCAPLLRRETVDAERERQLSARLLQLENLCGSTAHWISDSAEDRFGNMEELRKLLSAGWVALTASLVTDFEILLAPRRRFHESYQRVSTAGALPAANDAQTELTNLAGQQRWNAAAERLHEMELTDCARRLSLLQAEVSSLTSHPELQAPLEAKKEDAR